MGRIKGRWNHDVRYEERVMGVLPRLETKTWTGKKLPPLGVMIILLGEAQWGIRVTGSKPKL
jgi:hypothetical protein